jgi:formyl-CoA transferase
VAEVVATLQAASVPVGRIYTVKDIAEDPHYRARGMIESLTSADGLTLDVPGVVPKLSATPGAIRQRAPMLGEHQDEVMRPGTSAQ